MDRLLKNLSLYKQLILPMLIVGVLAFVAVFYAAVILEDSISALDHMHKQGGNKVTLLESSEDSVTQYRALMFKHLASENASAMSALEKKMEETEAAVNLTILFMTTDYPDVQPEIAVKIDTLQQSLQLFLERMQEIVELSADFEKELAFVLLTKVESEIYPRITNTIKELIRHEVHDISVSRENLVLAVRRNLLLTITIGILGGIFLFSIAFIVTRGITRRLSVLLDWSKNISERNWSQSLSTDSRDEVGKLTVAMEDMRCNIQSAHNQLAQSVQNAKDAAETLKIYANAFQNSGEPILITDENNNIININNAFTKQTGYSLEEVKGKNPRIFSSGKTPASTYKEMWDSLNETGFWQGELWDRTKSGRIYPKLAAISAIKNENYEDQFYIASFADISDRKATEERIAHLAHHDILTGLHNRFSLEDRLEQALSIANREQSLVALFFIDLDRFKNINDSLGHHAGDKLLIEVADRLKNCVRDSDIVARIGGDEFVIALTAMKDTTQAAVIAETLLNQVARPYIIEKHTLETSPSIGISIYPEDGTTFNDLMRNADIAMYHAKEQGRNTYHFFTDSMLIAAQDRLKFQAELRLALDNGQLELYYQPQVEVSKQRISSVEALVRWKHPERGMISPVVFIPIAEETGLIHELGKWVFNEACKQLAAWRSKGIKHLKMAINLSAKQLHSSELGNVVSTMLAMHQLHGRDLELEITETAAMTDPEIAVQQLDALRNLGVGLAIDDFGTGYSSLAYLKRLPIQTLKLDRAFVRDIEHDQNDLEISAATVSLAHNLGLKVVAEGVENEGQLNFLVANQFDYLQGYYFSKPLPAAEATRYLSEEHSFSFIDIPSVQAVN